MLKKVLVLIMTLMLLASLSIGAQAAGKKKTALDFKKKNEIISAVMKAPERRESTVDGYGYRQISDEAREVYEIVYNTIKRRSPDVLGLPVDMTADDIFMIIEYVIADHPEFFYTNGYGVLYTETKGDEVTSLTYKLTYREDERTYRQKKEAVEKATDEFLKKAPVNGSDYQKLLYTYNYIIDICDYDVDVYISAISNRSDPNYNDSASIYGVLVKNKAVCDGYARATQYLLGQLGVECIYACGYAGGESHAWNVVCLDDEYYCLDTTWGDPVSFKDGTGGLSYDYFCLTTKEMSKTHRPDGNLYDLPKCTATECNYYAKNGFYMESASVSAFKKALTSVGEKGKDVLYLKFEEKAHYDAILKLIKDGNSAVYSALKDAKKTKSKINANSYTYSYNDNLQTITLYIQYNK